MLKKYQIKCIKITQKIWWYEKKVLPLHSKSKIEPL